MPKQNKVTNKYFSFRPITKAGSELFGNMLAGFDWANVIKENSSKSADALEYVLRSFIEKCFPIKQRKIKSNDAPWFDNNCRRAVARKRRILLHNNHRARLCMGSVGAGKKIKKETFAKSGNRFDISRFFVSKQNLFKLSSS